MPLLVHLVETLNSGIALRPAHHQGPSPSALGNLGLVAALEILAREFTDQSGVQVTCALDPVALTPDAELTIYAAAWCRSDHGIPPSTRRARKVEVGCAERRLCRHIGQ